MLQNLASQLFRSTTPTPLLICFSHLRWNFVFQRPQHLLTRASSTYNVVYFEEPIFEASKWPTVRVTAPSPRIRVVTPILPAGTDAPGSAMMQRRLLDELMQGEPTHAGLVTWYYTPMAMSFSDHLEPDICIYDCMDELSAFKSPPAGLAAMETALFSAADLVFTGGQSLYAAKRRCHPRVYAFPSSIDAQHFNKARVAITDPVDQANIKHPRIGFFGVIDERMDLQLVAQAANELPECQFIMLGPVVKIDPALLPQGDNLHWLGGKSYDELPAYMANWTAGWMPFALNESTRYISPTKTPEFLAAGLPVVSTAIADVVRPYGALGIVHIAGPRDISAKLMGLMESADEAWLQKTDSFLTGMSWDQTWQEMLSHILRIQSLNGAVLMQRGA